MTTPYTYLIGWTAHNTWYYGVRWASKCDPSDLWTRYFTSSNYVSEKRAEWGEPDVIKIRKKFRLGVDARHWEERLLRRIKAVGSSKWLNKGNGGKEFRRPPLSEETRQRMSIMRKGIPSGKVMSASEKEKLRASKLGVPRSAETKAKLRAANLGKRLNADSIAKAAAKNTGKTRSEETKERMRLAWERRRLATPPLTVEQRHAKAARLHEWHATATPEAISVMKERAKISRIRLP